MRLGIVTPVVSRLPGVHGAWEEHGTIEQLAEIASVGEGLGYECLTCPEHIAIPTTAPDGGRFPGTCYWDPLPTYGYLSARTSTIRLATVILPLPYHHPLDIVKRYGTLDVISGGRVILGLGVGYLKPEFDALGIPFEGRNERSDDAILALKVAFGRANPTYDGAFYSFRDITVEPCGLQQAVPIWIGGGTRRSLRRAVEHGDAWYPSFVTTDQVRDWLAKEKASEAWEQREHPVEIILYARFDPLGDPEGTVAAARELRAAGADMLLVRLVHETLDQYLEQLKALPQLLADV